MSKKLKEQSQKMARFKTLNPYMLRSLQDQLQQNIDGQLQQFPLRPAEVILVRDVLSVIEDLNKEPPPKKHLARKVGGLLAVAVLLFVAALMVIPA